MWKYWCRVSGRTGWRGRKDGDGESQEELAKKTERDTGSAKVTEVKNQRQTEQREGELDGP